MNEQIEEIRNEIRTIKLRIKKIHVELDVIRGKLHEMDDVKIKVNMLWLER